MDAAIIAPIVTALAGIGLVVVQHYLNKNKSKSKDYREEIKELWDHSDDQDVKIRALYDRLVEKDKVISELQAKIGEEMFWKQRFTAENLENQMLKRRLADMEAHIGRLEVQIRELQK